MSSKARKRKSADYIYEDEPNKRRSTTPRNRDASPNDHLSTAARKKQNTLTQMGWIPSSRGDVDVDLEYERSPLEPKTYSKRRTSRRTKPKLLQSETITQMDFLSPTFPDESSLDLEEDTIATTPSAAPLGKKARESTREEPLARVVQSRNLQKKVSAGDQLVRSGSDHTGLRTTVGNNSQPAQQSAPDPATPRRQSSNVVRGEVPSSQSPPDSPLSTQSSRSLRQPSRSPLKERSTNILSPNRPVGKGILFPPRLEIEDTFGSDCEDIQTPTQAPSISRASQICYMPSAIRMRTDSQMTDIKRPIQDTQDGGAVTQDSVRTTATNVRTEIEDSDEDQEEDEIPEHESYPPCTRGTGHAAIDLPDESFRRLDPVSTTADISGTTAVRDFGLERADELIVDTVDTEHPRLPSRAASQLSIPDLDEEDDSHRQPTHLTDDQELDVDEISSTPLAALTSTAGQPASPEGHSNVDQLPQILAPETESQFENAWRTISPPPVRSPDMIPSSQPSSPPADTRNINPALAAGTFKVPPLPPLTPRKPLSPSQATTTDLTPTQPWRRASPRYSQLSPIRISSVLSTREVPLPSQATTTDVTQTQRSPRGPVRIDISSSPQRLSSPQPAPSLPPLSSSRSATTKHKSSPLQPISSSPRPPPLPPLSSSPLQARKWLDTDVYMGYAGGWDGKRRTASQLLPDSIMNDSILGPPGWGSQDDLDETLE